MFSEQYFEIINNYDRTRDRPLKQLMWCDHGHIFIKEFLMARGRIVLQLFKIHVCLLNGGGGVYM